MNHSNPESLLDAEDNQTLDMMMVQQKKKWMRYKMPLIGHNY